MATTTFEAKVEILGELWIDYRLDEGFKSFFEYNDLGCPLAYAFSSGIISDQPEAKKMVEESFDLLLGSLGLDDDIGFVSLTELFDFLDPEVQ
jgi:hypothetical protein